MSENKIDVLRAVCARLAVLGMIVAFVATLAASLIVPDVNAIADTISDAAAGRYDIVQDAGLYALAIGLLALAYGMRGRDMDSWSWNLSSYLIALMSLAVVVMAYWEGYSPGNSNYVVHYHMVYLYGASFLGILLLTARDLADQHKAWPWLNIGLAITWAALATYFFLMNTAWDGLVERVLALSQMIWLFLFAWKVEHEGGKSLLPDRWVPDLVTRNSKRSSA